MGAVGGLALALLIVGVTPFFPQATLATAAGHNSVLYNTGPTKYLGGIPSGYSVAPRPANAPSYPCPSNYNSTQCSQFKASCGNGVCDPNETCSTCPVDCGVPQGLTCDPYTGRAEAAYSGICELSIPYSNTNASGNGVLPAESAAGSAASTSPTTTVVGGVPATIVGPQDTSTRTATSSASSVSPVQSNPPTGPNAATNALSGGQPQRPGSLLTVLPGESVGNLLATLSPLIIGLLVAALIYGAYSRRQNASS